MSTIQNHRDLEAWQVSMDAVVETYRLSEAFPQKEIYGLQSQMRRAAVSVPSNVAEGQWRPLGAGINHLSIALGSLAELDTQLEVAIRLKYVTEDAVKEMRCLVESSRRLVSGLRRSKRIHLTGAATALGVLVFGLLSQVVR